VSIDEPRPSGSVVSCELELADGRWVSVGTWSASDAAGAVWAAGVDDALLDAVAMRLVDADGQVIATAIMV